MTIDIAQHYRQRQYVEAVRIEMIAQLNRGRASGEHPDQDLPSAVELEGIKKLAASRGLKGFEIIIQNGEIQIAPEQPKKSEATKKPKGA